MMEDRATILWWWPPVSGGDEKFLSANPGLQSRFAKYLQFDDYSPKS